VLEKYMEGRGVSAPTTSPDSIPASNPIKMKIHLQQVTPYSCVIVLIVMCVYYDTQDYDIKDLSHRSFIFVPFPPKKTLTLTSVLGFILHSSDLPGVTLRTGIDLTHNLSYVMVICALLSWNPLCSSSLILTFKGR